MIVKTEEALLQGIIAEVVARTGASDIRAGGTMYQYAKALARQLYMVQAAIVANQKGFYLSSAVGSDLDKRVADFPPNTLVRSAGNRGLGGVVIFRRTTTPGPLTISAGTLVIRSADNYRYTTTSDATFGPVDLVSTSVSVVAQDVGTKGNCVAGEIDKLGSPITGITAVTNTSAIQNGTDEESDEELRIRAQLYVKGIARSTTAALIQAALSVNDDVYGAVKFAKVAPVNVDYPGCVTLYIDDGAGTAGLRTTVAAGEILLNSASGGETVLYLANRPPATAPIIEINAVSVSYKIIYPWGQVQVPALTAGDQVTADTYDAYIGLVALVQQVIDGKPYDPINYPGYRAAGEIVTVLPAQMVGAAYVDIEIWLEVEADTDRESLISVLKSAIVAHVNSLDIGESLYRAAIIDIAMEQSGVKNIPRVELNGSNADLHAGDEYVIRTSDNNITLR